MYLKSLTITNYRKFGNDPDNNTIHFVAKGTHELNNPNKTEGDSSADIEKNNSIASATTLIVGKNNSGKTTITKALEKLISDSTDLGGNDFNFQYLNNFLRQYTNPNKTSAIELPYLKFDLTVCINGSMDATVTNLKPFMDISTVLFADTSDLIEIKIGIKYSVKEEEVFRDALDKLITKHNTDRRQAEIEPSDQTISKDYDAVLFRKFVELIDSEKFKCTSYGLNGEATGFRLSNLLELKLISANNNLNSTALSSVFNKIIKTRYKSVNAVSDLDNLMNNIDSINDQLSQKITSAHTASVRGALGEIESTQRFTMSLRSDLNFEKLMKDLITYEYSEHGSSIPESQFGLGYTNLMSIIGEIIHYIEEYPEIEVQSKINIICIEEPETFMHPQMQELFIKHIDDAIKHLLGSSSKKINSQLIITTHSSHILNSKIHSSNSFDNVNYIAINGSESQIVRLDDNAVSSSAIREEDSSMSEKEFKKKRLDDLKFLKTHIKYKVSELFFADAIIFVEGVTEETLLNYYIDQMDGLNKFYITVFNINGAHGKIYYPLIKLLKVPTLVITDLDILRSDEDKTRFRQIKDLTDKDTTNETIKKFNQGSKKLEKITEYFTEDNLHVVFQKDSVETYYATSLEEAFILVNYKNDLLNRVLIKLKPNIYKKIVGEPEDREKLKHASYQIQKKLSGSKSAFANTLLYEFTTKEDSEELPKLPKYIEEGLNWLQKNIEQSYCLRAVE